MRNLKKQHNLSTFFVQSIDIGPKLTRKKTNAVKALFKDKNHYRMVSSTQPFDYLPLKNRKAEPAKFYELNFRIVRFPISEDTYETVVTNLDKDKYSPADLKKLSKIHNRKDMKNGKQGTQK